jgi:hypothetical protein
MKNWRKGENSRTLIKCRRQFLQPFGKNYVNLWSIFGGNALEPFKTKRHRPFLRSFLETAGIYGKLALGRELWNIN